MHDVVIVAAAVVFNEIDFTPRKLSVTAERWSDTSVDDEFIIYIIIFY